MQHFRCKIWNLTENRITMLLNQSRLYPSMQYNRQIAAVKDVGGAKEVLHIFCTSSLFFILVFVVQIYNRAIVFYLLFSTLSRFSSSFSKLEFIVLLRPMSHLNICEYFANIMIVQSIPVFHSKTTEHYFQFMKSLIKSDNKIACFKVKLNWTRGSFFVFPPSC